MKTKQRVLRDGELCVRPGCGQPAAGWYGHAPTLAGCLAHLTESAAAVGRPWVAPAPVAPQSPAACAVQGCERPAFAALPGKAELLCKRCLRRMGSELSAVPDAALTPHDPETGEVLEAPPTGKRGRMPKLARERFMTEEEKAELAAQAEWRLQDRERKEAMRAAIVALLPVEALQTQGEPPIQAEPLIPLDERTAAGEMVLDAPRPSGSRFVCMVKRYDGTAVNASPSGIGLGARTYAHAAIWFRKPPGKLFRSKGIAVERAELRPFAAALLALADRLDAEDAEEKKRA